ncbi:hypothetical protein EX895_000623 [Sporisorium graminicola]|uniref:Uncharacterized protein n=1 Tax=Sporisorium graminicola TaxID=280036 RepID=A0A4U7L0G0_9BASI|nr:hypothetical protein EX895_000623 [Sporisorium graminicola]TKY90625.1 hypothetical protein EX895_000623 [Sporisorium graminicola]
MSSQTGAGTGASSPPQPHGRPKKNSIGSWFSKKFGKRPNEAALDSNGTSSNGRPGTGAGGTVPTRRGAAREDDRLKTATLPNINGAGAQRASVPGQQAQFNPAFTPNQAHGLANTLTVPSNGGQAQGRLTPPPRLEGIPTQEPLGAIDLPRSPRPDAGAALAHQSSGALSPSTVTYDKPLEPVLPNANDTLTHPNTDLDHHSEQASGPGAAAAIRTAIISDAPTTAASANDHDTDNDSSLTGRDSIGNRTMDTSKSRASTKPTTLMSLDTREPTVLPTTHIAQPRQSGGDDSFGNSARLSTGPREGSAIHFAAHDSVSRSGSGQMGNGSAAGEGGSTFINVPTYSRPHPNNNPHPSAIPADNASILTLASSTAGMSLGGASRSHHHVPSLGGARSIGGSLMGDRRNSSDTSASLKALPPLSRRGSDSSSRTRDSFLASSTGQTSHQAMYAPTGVYAAPGAPSDRVSLHRTPSQKTVATQLSVPLSTSASNAALNAYARSEHTANGSQLHLAGSQSTNVTAEPDMGGEALSVASEAGHSVETDKSLEAATGGGEGLLDSQLTTQAAPADGLLETQASNLAATEHDEALLHAEQQRKREQVDVGVKSEEPFDVPGGPPVA